ncbi:MAG: hypothetical protein IT215_03710, partial [Chitinophagaceae bacterium]|nr:hypothetical protein [Chitinophagaceae bacterium]
LYAKLLDKPLIAFAEVAQHLPNISEKSIPDLIDIIKKSARISDAGIRKKRYFSDGAREVVALLNQGRSEKSPSLSFKNFESAKNLSQGLILNDPLFAQLYLESIREIGHLERNPSAKNKTWDFFLNKTLKLLKKHDEDLDFLYYACDGITSYAQEPYIDIDHTLLKQAIDVARNKIDLSIKRRTKNDPMVSDLLAKKSALLRHSTKFQINDVQQHSMAEQSLRCIELSLSIRETWYAYLEHGNSLWHSTLFEKHEKAYNNKVKEAEKSYWKSQNMYITVQNTLAQCNLFRNTYQSAPFLKAFEQYEGIEKNRKRYLDNSVMLSDMILALYYAGCPEEELIKYLPKGIKLLEDAIAEGLGDARKIINLAFLKAANGEPSIGRKILTTLKAGDSKFDWDIIIKDIQEFKNSDDLFAQGFVLGIDESNTWNKLGTYVFDFLNDIDLSKKMYETSLNLNPTNPIVLTNLARLLVLNHNNDINTIEDAEYYISKASYQSTFRFQWWRGVREQVNLAKQNLLSIHNEEEVAFPTKKNIPNLTKIGNLYRLFNILKNPINFEKRELNLNKIVKSLFTLSLGNSFHVLNQGYENNDNVYFFDKDYYKYKVVWYENECPKEDLILFRSEITTPRLIGLFISFNGFSKSAIEYVKSINHDVIILLMDGQDIELALIGSPSFDEAIRIKQLHFHCGNPYYQMSSSRTNSVKNSMCAFPS